MNITGLDDTQINKLKALMDAGLITPDDLSQSSMSGSFGPPQNALAQVVNPPPDQPRESVRSLEQTIPALAQPSSFQPPPPSSQDMRARGQQFVRNEDTGQTIMMPPQPQGGGTQGRPTMMRVVGAGNGQVTQLSPEMGAPPQLDQSRPQIDIPGVGKGTYGADGNAYVANPDGTTTKVLLGYDAQGSAALTKANLANAATAASTAHTLEETRASKANSPDFGSVGTSGATGDAALGSLDPGIAATLKAMNDGKIAPPTGAALRNPRVMQLLALGAQVYPGFDMTTWTTRYKTAQDFASGGKSGQAITSYSTLLDHANDVAKTGEALKNFGGFPFSNDVNDVVNNIEGRSGDPRVTAFLTAKTNFDNELAKAMASGHITDSSVAKQAQTLSMGQSDAQREAALKEIVSLLGSKINETGNAYIRGMGKSGVNPADLLTPGAKATYLKYVGVDSPSGTLMDRPQGAASAAPQARGSGPSFAALPNPSTFKGRRMQSDDGSLWQSNGSQWMRVN